jgi:hypothetical protein
VPRRGAAFRRRAAPCVGLVAFGLASAGVVLVGRVVLGAESAAHPRYASLAIPAVVGAHLLLAACEPGGGRRSPLRLVLLAAIVASVAWAAAWELHLAPDRRRFAEQMREAVLLGESATDEELASLNWKAASVRDGIGILRRHRLSVFRGTP